MKEAPRYSFNSHESLGEAYGLTVQGEKKSLIARGKAREEASGVGIEVNTALSRPHSRAEKRATLQHTLPTPSNRAFPPKSTLKITTRTTLRSNLRSTLQTTPRNIPKGTTKNTLRTTPRNTQKSTPRITPKNTWKNRSENPSPQPVYTITGCSSQRQRARQGSPTLTCAEWD